MARKSWQELPSGPDWMDVYYMMQAIESLHGCMVVITLGLAALGGPGGSTTIAAIRTPKEASVLGQQVLAISGEWPCRDHKDLCACVFAGLYELDAEITKNWWEQKTLA